MNGGRVHALFVYEGEQDEISANFVDRQGGDATLPARTSWLKARWLRDECERLGIPTISARPWETAVNRAIETLATST